MPLFDKLGFRWDRSNVPVSTPTSVAEILASFRRRRAEVVYDASALEGNPLSFQEVAALLAGDPVSGHDPADLRQVRNLAAAAQELAILVEAGRFRLNKTTSDRLHALIAREEALEWGQFRGEGQYCDITPRVSLGVGTFIPSHPTR